MACVTLKRPLPESLLDNHPNVGHVGHSPHHSPHAVRPPPTKRRRCAPYNLASRHELHVEEPSPSVFKETPLSATEIANNLRDELKRLKKRRQLAVNIGSLNSASATSKSAILSPNSPNSNSDTEPMDDVTAIRTASGALNKSNSTCSTSTSSSPSSSNQSNQSNSNCNPNPISASQLLMQSGKPIFTLKQMTMICEKMCKDRTDQVRQEYDKILQQKMAEQYDAFVKFIDHQIQQRFNQAQLPSYLS